MKKNILFFTANYPTKNEPHRGIFIKEQFDSLCSLSYNYRFELLNFKGSDSKINYLNALKKLKDRINKKNYALIHAHYGLNGTIASMQSKVPVITTYHGSDINYWRDYIFSYPGIRRSVDRIVVDRKMGIKIKDDFQLIPCGVDTEIFKPISYKTARIKLGYPLNAKIIIFPGDKSRVVKNYKLFELILNEIKYKVYIVELVNMSREQVSMALNACDLVLMTSLSEGSPQVIKEAMSCNIPILSTDVGDVKERIQNCNVSDVFDHNNYSNIIEKINYILNGGVIRTNGRDLIKEQELDLMSTSKKIIKIYEKFI